MTLRLTAVAYCCLATTTASIRLAAGEDSSTTTLQSLVKELVKGTALKVVSDEKEGGWEVGSIDRYWSGTLVLDTLFYLKYAAIFKLIIFRFRRVHVKK